MLPLNFNQLYYFWAAARAGSISGAREAVLLTQATLSAQIKQLESSLGKRLLVRSRRGVTPTAEGKAMLDFCDRFFARTEEAVSLARSGPAAAARPLQMGIKSSVSREKVLPVLDFLRRAHPALPVQVFSGGAGELRDRFIRRAMDFAVSDVDLSASLGEDFRARLAARVSLHFVGAPALKKKMAPFPRGLAGVPLLVRSPDHPIRKETEQYIRRRGLSPVLGAEVENTDLLRMLLLRGEGVAAMDDLTVREDLRLGRLVRLHASPLSFKEDVWFICRRRPEEDPRFNRAVNGLMEGFRLPSPPRGGIC
jgi:LysR family transcriptional activator of nhaA